MAAKKKFVFNTEVAKKLSEIPLAQGNHTLIEEGMCIMEAIAFIAGEEHSDHPSCVDPDLTEVFIAVNDELENSKEREFLKDLVPVIIGTKNPTIKIALARQIYTKNFIVEHFIFPETKKRMDDIAKPRVAFLKKIKADPSSFDINEHCELFGDDVFLSNDNYDPEINFLDTLDSISDHDLTVAAQDVTKFGDKKLLKKFMEGLVAIK